MIFFLELVLLALWVRRGDAHYYRFSEITFYMGYVFVWGAALSGLHATGGFGNIQGDIRKHFLAAISILVFYTARLIYMKQRKGNGGIYPRAQLVGALLGNAIVFYTGYLGGRLVYL